jgi:aldehyde:ferredoxin oxidoreductase
MRGQEARRLLILEPARRRYHLRLLEPAAHLPLLSGEVLCHTLLREEPDALVVARGPMPFLSGNKTTVGYLSPLTGLPHYSFVGGRGFAELCHLGLDAILFSGDPPGTSGLPPAYVVVSGRAPHLSVEWKPADDLPAGQRSAFYWLLDRELGTNQDRGSLFTIGHGARLGYRTANLAVDGLYHAGRGGAGSVLARFVPAMVLRGEPRSWESWFPGRAERFWALREGEFRQRLEATTERLSRPGGGTIPKLYTTGRGSHPTLPARNAQRLGYGLADLGAAPILAARRAGQTGCHWCQVNCRHWHWVPAAYAPAGRDRFLDDFEPTYSLLAMLDLAAPGGSTRDKLQLWAEVDRQVVLPLEEMGCDVIDIGLGLALLFEGLERGLVPGEDVPPCLQEGTSFGDLSRVAAAVAALGAGDAGPALRAAADGPQALAEAYPALRDLAFSSGPGTLGNPGHANALWTFLLPFGRFFGHYVGQLYKIEGELPPGGQSGAIDSLFRRVVHEALQREFFGVLCNALSACAFTFALFSQDGRGVTLDDGDLLVRMLACYGLETSREELEWFAQAFWAESIALKLQRGWRPPSAADYPGRVFEALAQALHRPPAELRALLDSLIAEWQRQAGEVLYRHGYGTSIPW